MFGPKLVHVRFDFQSKSCYPDRVWNYLSGMCVNLFQSKSVSFVWLCGLSIVWLYGHELGPESCSCQVRRSIDDLGSTDQVYYLEPEVDASATSL